MKNILLTVIFLSSCASLTKPIYTPHLASEGDFVMIGNPAFSKYVEKELKQSDLIELEQKLKHALEIPLTQKGFVQAANRSEKQVGDETNYDAIWVRDSIWVYFAFSERGEREKARKVILAIWDYYGVPEQLKRFENIIKNPALASVGGMNVPHIRFNGRSDHLSDVTLEGKPEDWNHRQNDAHGLFLLGLATGLKDGLIKSGDLNSARLKSLNLFVPYFEAIQYWDFPDAGAWEEISKINTSSVSMVVKAMENWEEMLGSYPQIKWNRQVVKKLVLNGYARIRHNLGHGGESPDHDTTSQAYRREDAALFNLFLPFPLKQLSGKEKLLALTILEKLIRPYGVIRYPLDSYQSGNYWNKSSTPEGLPELTGDSSSPDSFKARFKQFIPNTEAQWFFDSKLAMIYLQFSQGDKQYLRLAQLHFKRALGQITPEHGVVLAADGRPVMNLAFPESINTIVKDGRTSFVPSPITPLNWAKASFSMALIRLKKELN